MLVIRRAWILASLVAISLAGLSCSSSAKMAASKGSTKPSTRAAGEWTLAQYLHRLFTLRADCRFCRPSRRGRAGSWVLIVHNVHNLHNARLITHSRKSLQGNDLGA